MKEEERERERGRIGWKEYKGIFQYGEMCSQDLVRDVEYMANVCICQNSANGTLEFCVYHCM